MALTHEEGDLEFVVTLGNIEITRIKTSEVIPDISLKVVSTEEDVRQGRLLVDVIDHASRLRALFKSVPPVGDFDEIAPVHKITVEGQPIADQMMVQCTCGWRQAFCFLDYPTASATHIAKHEAINAHLRTTEQRDAMEEAA